MTATLAQATLDLRHTGAPGRIGPNAILRTLEVLEERLTPADLRALLGLAGLEGLQSARPTEMVDEAMVAALFRAVSATLGEADAQLVQWEAGQRTARYLLAHRVPKPVQTLLRALPAGLAAPLLLRSVAAHAWTFAGTGRFAWTSHWRGAEVAVAGCPLCRGRRAALPLCAFYAGTFAGLFRALVARDCAVTERLCEARGQASCAFELRWH